MNYKKISGLVEGIIESEFSNVQEFRELSFSSKDLNQNELDKEVLRKWDKLNGSVLEEQKELIDELETALANKWINMCKFYFTEGVGAGLSNLKFLNDIDSVESYIR